jgi:hypothetical protein
MNILSVTRLYRPLIGALLIGLVGVSQASADFVRFLEGSNDTGTNLTLTGDVFGATFGPVTTTGESLTLTVTFETWTVTDFHNTYNILESTGALSDLLEVTGISTLHRIIVSFTSDTENGPPLVSFLHPTATITETGAPQDVDAIVGYARDPAGVPHDLTLTIQSDAQAVPEPTTGLLLLAGCAGLLRYGWRRKRLQG